MPIETKHIVLSALLNMVGRVPYKWGGQNPLEGLDCSGLAIYTLRMLGQAPKVDDTAAGLYEHLSRPYRLSGLAGAQLNHARQALAFAFFGHTAESIKHVGVLLNERLMVEAYGDSTVTDLETAVAYDFHNGAFVRISPIRRRTDLYDVVLPESLA